MMNVTKYVSLTPKGYQKHVIDCVRYEVLGSYSITCLVKCGHYKFFRKYIVT